MFPGGETGLRRTAIGADAKKQMVPRLRQADLFKGF